MKLGFEFGYLLPDPHALLEGDGKRLRYVVLEKGDRIPVDSILRIDRDFTRDQRPMTSL